MATQAFRALTSKGTHEVGNLVSTQKYIKDVANGALFTEDVDNFTLVEAEFNAKSGQFEAKSLTDATKKNVFLVAAVERCLLGESIGHFFVGKGERGRIVYLTQGLIFDSSAYTLDPAATKIEAGLKAHFDKTTKKFIIHKGAHGGYATASVKFTVKSGEDNLSYTLGKPMVRFIVD